MTICEEQDIEGKSFWPDWMDGWSLNFIALWAYLTSFDHYQIKH